MRRGWCWLTCLCAANTEFTGSLRFLHLLLGVSGVQKHLGIPDLEWRNYCVSCLPCLMFLKHVKCFLNSQNQISLLKSPKHWFKICFKEILKPLIIPNQFKLGKFFHMSGPNLTWFEYSFFSFVHVENSCPALPLTTFMCFQTVVRSYPLFFLWTVIDAFISS